MKFLMMVIRKFTLSEFLLPQRNGNARNMTRSSNAASTSIPIALYFSRMLRAIFFSFSLDQEPSASIRRSFWIFSFMVVMAI